MTRPNPEAVRAHNEHVEAEEVADELMDTDPVEAWDRAIIQCDTSLAGLVSDAPYKDIEDIIFELLTENILETGEDPR